MMLFLSADEQLDAAYEEVKSVTSIGRGVGAWGDMVVTLNDGSKIEMRSLPRCAGVAGLGCWGSWVLWAMHAGCGQLAAEQKLGLCLLAAPPQLDSPPPLRCGGVHPALQGLC